MTAPCGVEDEILVPVFRRTVQEFPFVPVRLTPCLKLPVAVTLNLVVENCEHNHIQPSFYSDGVSASTASLASLMA